MTSWKRWKFKNLTFLLISISVAFFLFQFEPFHVFLLRLQEFGYIGAFFAGILFVSTFTIASGALILLVLAEKLSPLEIGVIAGLGAVLGDFFIFRFIKDNLSKEVTDIYDQLDGHHHIKKVLHTKYFAWTLPVAGALIIASPLPDEIGVSLMGLSKMSSIQFMIVSFLLNAVGIFLIVSASTVIKP